MPPKSKIEARSVDDYLAALSEEQRKALEQLRRTILVAAPQANECISYHIPTVRLGGRMLVAYGAAANHCAFYAGAHPMAVHRDELSAYDTGKGTIRFQATDPLPAALVRKLVETRIAQYGARDAARRAVAKPVSSS
jgi:uncharacterized protein YdhG (YjbR/CyaY superfamily)